MAALVRVSGASPPLVEVRAKRASKPPHLVEPGLSCRDDGLRQVSHESLTDRDHARSVVTHGTTPSLQPGSNLADLGDRAVSDGDHEVIGIIVRGIDEQPVDIAEDDCR